MPNTFTPNSDGLNDLWMLDFTNYDAAEIIVFNKWGSRVWEDFTTLPQWDGTSLDNSVLPSATYYYVVKLTPLGGEPIEQTGPITIIR
jgi:gliding motility-associated-like protein